MKMEQIFLECILMSFWAYPWAFPDWSVKKLERNLNRLGFENFHWIENEKTDTQAFMCSKGEFAYLIFRGSYGIPDWYTNVDFKLVRCKFGRQHRGFRDDARSVYFPIVNELAYHLKAGRLLVLTGHSQGADVACSEAFELLTDKRQDQILTVPHYGGARMADEEAAAYMDRNHPDLFARFVNNNDIVPCVPFDGMGVTDATAYKHFGVLYYLTHDFRCIQDPERWTVARDKMLGLIDAADEKGLDIFEDHYPGKRYMGAIKKCFPDASLRMSRTENPRC